MPHYHVKVVVTASEVVSVENDLPANSGPEPLAYRVTVELINRDGPTPPFYISRIFELDVRKSHEKAIIDVYTDALLDDKRVYKAWRLVLGNVASQFNHTAFCRVSLVSESTKRPAGSEIRRTGMTVDVLMNSQSDSLIAQPAKLHIQFKGDKEVVMPLFPK